MEINPKLLNAEFMQRCKLKNCKAACCLYGVWIDKQEAERIMENAAEILPYMPDDRREPAQWLDGRKDQDPFTISGQVVHSAVMDNPKHYGGTECVFLRKDHKCALQVASEAAGHHPWYFKPFYCILHPLDLDEEGRITIDETELLLEEQGSCLRPSRTPIPLIITFEEELLYFLGKEKYHQLLEQIQPQN